MPGIQEITQSLGLDFSSESKGKFKGLEAICYRINATQTSNADPITDLEVADEDYALENEAKLPTDSDFVSIDGSNYFQFSSVGMYLVILFGYIYSSAAGRNKGVLTFSSTNNITAPDWKTNVWTSGYGESSSSGNSVFSGGLLYVDDITNNRGKISYNQSNVNADLSGDSAYTSSGIIFIKLADI